MRFTQFSSSLNESLPTTLNIRSRRVPAAVARARVELNTTRLQSPTSSDWCWGTASHGRTDEQGSVGAHGWTLCANGPIDHP
eukprot:6989486-Prymnesium_polylepis.1